MGHKAGMDSPRARHQSHHPLRPNLPAQMHKGVARVLGRIDKEAIAATKVGPCPWLDTGCVSCLSCGRRLALGRRMSAGSAVAWDALRLDEGCSQSSCLWMMSLNRARAGPLPVQPFQISTPPLSSRRCWQMSCSGSMTMSMMTALTTCSGRVSLHPALILLPTPHHTLPVAGPLLPQ